MGHHQGLLDLAGEKDRDRSETVQDALVHHRPTIALPGPSESELLLHAHGRQRRRSYAWVDHPVPVTLAFDDATVVGLGQARNELPMLGVQSVCRSTSGSIQNRAVESRMSVFMMAVVRRVVTDDSVRLPYGEGTPMSKGPLRCDRREVRGGRGLRIRKSGRGHPPWCRPRGVISAAPSAQWPRPDRAAP